MNPKRRRLAVVVSGPTVAEEMQLVVEANEMHMVAAVARAVNGGSGNDQTGKDWAMPVAMATR